MRCQLCHTEELTVEEMRNVQWCPSCMKRIDSFLERNVLKFEEVEVFKSSVELREAENENSKILESILPVKKTDFNDFVGFPFFPHTCCFEKHFI